ncbi:MAG: hypothetical protein Ct9H300mP31_11830 [Acidimicrobiaceae bacterium]|nr:MAG: hypothetical protein Ct9H300mP31_11830 [Acidimicrobiaceae bacterium]
MTEPADLSADLPAEAAAAEVRDSLPDDLDARGMVGPYVFPDNDRRRIPGVIYLALALATVVAVLVADGSPLVDGGLVAGAVALALLGAYHLQAGWSLGVDEADALVAAVREGGLPGRPCLGPDGVARPPQSSHVAGPGVLQRVASRTPWLGVRGRRRQFSWWPPTSKPTRRTGPPGTDWPGPGRTAGGCRRSVRRTIYSGR